MHKICFQLVIILTLGLGLSACHKKKGGLYAGVDGDYVTGTPLGERFEGANFFGASVTRGQFSPVYFAYDNFEVSGAEQSKVQQVATAMKASDKKLIVAGFTDDRGTEEYNRGLGERRALAVRQALIAAGIPADRVQTVSFGKEMPADSGSGESAWTKNRRAEFGVVK